METNRIEYKRELTEDVEKEVIAFLNKKEGGLIVVGLNNDGSVFGIENPDETQLQIKNRLRDNISPSCLGLFDIETIDSSDKSYLKINIASGPKKPYFLKKYGMTPKGAFIRIATAAEPMSQAMIDSLYSKRIRNSLGSIPSPKQNLTFTLLKIYYQGAGKALNKNFLQNLELINSDRDLNYVAYLMSDQNNVSVQVAKYDSYDRANLIESYELGYTSLIKSTQDVLDKIKMENKIVTKITSSKRQEKRIWDEIALREAIINAFVHNDYSNEVMPKFEIFPNRIEITSAGGLPKGLTMEEFYSGFSVPRNQELMRIYKDLNYVEQLGSGIQRILRAYDRDSFEFSTNFLRIIYFTSNSTLLQVNTQVNTQVAKLLSVLSGEHSRQELQQMLGLKDRENFRKNYLQPALEKGYIERTIPEKPNSKNQKYRLSKLSKFK